METSDADVLDLRDYFDVLRRRWVTVVGVTLLTFAAALSGSLLQTPVYEGTTTLAIEPVRQSGDAALEDLILGESVVETERRVITSRPVTERVIEDLGLDDADPSELVEHVRVTVINNTRVVDIVATDTDPERAADLANAYANGYLEYRRDQALDEVTAARANLDERAEELRQQIGELDDDGGSEQRDSLVQQLAQVEGQLASLDPGVEAIRGGGQVLVPAEAERQPVSPRPLRTGAIALVLGLMLGVGLAFLRDHFDDAVRGENDVKRAAGGRPILGRVTHWEDRRADQRLITLVDPHHVASEEYRGLAANVRFALVRHHHGERAGTDEFRQQSVLMTSANAGEGKSTTSANLAVAASLAGLRVILVEADLRQPTLSQRFGLAEGLGLSDLLVDARLSASMEWVANHLVDVGMRNLRILPAGTVPPNPNELLASPQTSWLHEHLVGVADLVIYDSPPVLPVADTLEIAQHVDTTLLVVRPGTSHRRELQHAVERLDAIGADLGGFVINDVAQGKRSAYGYGYRPQTYAPRGGGSAPGPTAGYEAPAPAQDPTFVRELRGEEIEERRAAATAPESSTDRWG